MVKAVENWAFLEGIVEVVRPSEVRSDLAVVDLVVDRIEADEHYPNLFGEDLHAMVSVVMPEAVARKIKIVPGTRIRCRARKESPFAVFADPHDVAVLEQPAASEESV